MVPIGDLHGDGDCGNSMGMETNVAGLTRGWNKLCGISVGM